MAVSLTKGGNVSLNKAAGAAGLSKITVGLGWDARVTDGASFDLDASAFLLNSQGRVSQDADFIFYNNLTSVDGAVQHMGDNLTGDGDGDDEQVQIDLSALSSGVERVAICVTIHEAESRRQNFGMVGNAFVRVCNDVDGRELARYDLSEDMSTETAMIFAEVYRRNGEWKFKAIGQGFSDGLGPLARHYGVNV